MSPAVAVVVCAFTERRWDDLVAACASLRAQTHPPEKVVVVIDHNDALLRRAHAELTDVHVVPNIRTQGLSGARNTGVDAVDADVVLFLDDDAVADPRWVEQLLVHFDDGAVVGAGGYAQPEWDGAGIPWWYPTEFLWVVGCSYEGLPADGKPIRNPIGCSMAFRRNAIVDAGGFVSSLGRLGSKPLGGEETELSIRIAQREPSTRIVHAATAVVHHRVPRNRQTVTYFTRRCFWEGVSKSRIALSAPRAALSAEKGFVVRTLTRGIRARGGQFLRDRSPRHLTQSLTMLWGVTAAGTGYLYDRVARTSAQATRTAFAVRQ
ncbi:MAG TPA: glycosyltransferase family 2 protein [Ilumatobacteraceae bacterium]|nr:glycosyltransferase family 2 protein [Ilumatobacteraceae bacterium]